MAEQRARPRVVVLAMGGTIASVPGGDGRAAVPTLTGEDLVLAVPGLSEVAQVDATTVRQTPSGDLAWDDVSAVVERAEGHLNSGAAGVVVTQGTATLEETSFAADLLYAGDAPLVFTGAMRHPGLVGADGAANLLAAAQVACSPRARSLGTLVVLNDEIHCARFVHKTHTSSPSAFRSWPAGPVGWVSEGDVRVVAGVPRLQPLGGAEAAHGGEAGAVPPVALVTMSLGDDGRMLGALPEWGYRGLVLEAFGGGHVPRAAVAAVGSLAEDMPVVLASRTGSGEILRRTYGFPGSEQDLLARGVIPAGWLDGLKARVLLSLLLGRGVSTEEIRSRFESFTAFGIPPHRVRSGPC